MKLATWIAFVIINAAMMVASMHLATQNSFTSASKALRTVLTPIPTVSPTPDFGSFRARVELPTTVLQVGEPLEIEAYLYNDSEAACIGGAVFQLRIETTPGVEQDQGAPVLEPARPRPVDMAIWVTPGGSAMVPFSLRAVRPGIVTLRLNVSGEVSLGPNCSPSYTWGGADARSTLITVNQKTLLPLIQRD